MAYIKLAISTGKLLIKGINFASLERAVSAIFVIEPKKPTTRPVITKPALPFIKSVILGGRSVKFTPFAILITIINIGINIMEKGPFKR